MQRESCFTTPVRVPVATDSSTTFQNPVFAAESTSVAIAHLAKLCVVPYLLILQNHLMRCRIHHTAFCGVRIGPYPIPQIAPLKTTSSKWLFQVQVPPDPVGQIRHGSWQAKKPWSAYFSRHERITDERTTLTLFPARISALLPLD